jgi:hypothetical protein
MRIASEINPPVLYKDVRFFHNVRKETPGNEVLAIIWTGLGSVVIAKY